MSEKADASASPWQVVVDTCVALTSLYLAVWGGFGIKAPALVWGAGIVVSAAGVVSILMRVQQRPTRWALVGLVIIGVLVLATAAPLLAIVQAKLMR